MRVIIRFPRILSVLSTMVVLGVARLSAAQTISPIEQSADMIPGQPAPQKYDGVVPGADSKNPLPPAPSDRSYLVWTGFQMTGTGSRVFLQTTKPLEHTLTEGKRSKGGASTMVLTLLDCKIHMANNRRTVDTRYFATPVTKVTARQKKSNVEVRIALREPVSVVPKTEPGPSGTVFLVLDFPLGKATVADAPGSGKSLGTPEQVQNSADSAEPSPGKGSSKTHR